MKDYKIVPPALMIIILILTFSTINLGCHNQIKNLKKSHATFENYLEKDKYGKKITFQNKKKGLKN